ncbi:hypothetical protein [uncultured Herbaspirillum sp.]|uniref:hypothetical protein n=1 Tax=uncultured Herbaspirillum sp. TaxID=160236 RepID=UPI00260B1174|nr:hypothetical protein [uncultured Herbaspirillum sp.]
MRRPLLAALVLCSASAFLPARAASSGPVANAPEGSLRQTLMTHAVVLRGQIDGRQIQLSLQPKKNEDGLEGRYFFFGGSPEILVAGEVDGDDLLMEESVNGKDVSGQWEGHRQGQSITGTWSNADGSINKPFALQLP